MARRAHEFVRQYGIVPCSCKDIVVLPAREKAKVIDPPAMSICLLECGGKGGFLGCRRPGLRISMDGHDVAMRELVRFIECNP